jgi:endonuclease YncB( thermonuclease family)
LAGIDAPERNQPWGETATRELRRQVAGRFAVVDWNKKDHWKRLIGVVRLIGDAQKLHMIDRGLAWHYKRYEREQSPSDRQRYAEAETAACEAKLGLWSDPDPVAPWDWRKRRKVAGFRSRPEATADADSESTAAQPSS